MKENVYDTNQQYRPAKNTPSPSPRPNTTASAKCNAQNATTSQTPAQSTHLKIYEQTSNSQTTALTQDKSNTSWLLFIRNRLSSIPIAADRIISSISPRLYRYCLDYERFSRFAPQTSPLKTEKNPSLESVSPTFQQSLTSDQRT